MPLLESGALGGGRTASLRGRLLRGSEQLFRQPSAQRLALSVGGGARLLQDRHEARALRVGRLELLGPLRLGAPEGLGLLRHMAIRARRELRKLLAEVVARLLKRVRLGLGRLRLPLLARASDGHLDGAHGLLVRRSGERVHLLLSLRAHAEHLLRGGVSHLIKCLLRARRKVHLLGARARALRLEDAQLRDLRLARVLGLSAHRRLGCLDARTCCRGLSARSVKLRAVVALQLQQARIEALRLLSDARVLVAPHLSELRVLAAHNLLGLLIERAQHRRIAGCSTAAQDFLLRFAQLRIEP